MVIPKRRRVYNKLIFGGGRTPVKPLNSCTDGYYLLLQCSSEMICSKPGIGYRETGDIDVTCNRPMENIGFYAHVTALGTPQHIKQWNSLNSLNHT